MFTSIAHHEHVRDKETSNHKTCGNKHRCFGNSVIVVRLNNVDHDERAEWEQRQEHTRPFGLGSNRFHAAEQLEARTNNLSQTVQNLGEVTTRLLLNCHGYGEETHVLHFETFCHRLERFTDITTIGRFVRDNAHFRAQGIGHFFGDDRDADVNG